MSAASKEGVHPKKKGVASDATGSVDAEDAAGRLELARRPRQLELADRSRSGKSSV
jgi:hypothetical protein